MINLSVNSGIFPDKLKIAKVLPLFKSGDKFDLVNFRPVSVLVAFSKIFEKIMYNRLVEYLNENKIITDSQYGFLKNKSTESAITTFTNHILKAYDKREYTIGVFLDLSKAFDTVDHNILLRKLHHYGIRGKIHKWFSSYLSSRTQYVSLDNNLSSVSTISHGVPQSSILGPILFLIYINDLVNSSNHNIIMYADDTCLYSSGNSLNELINSINNDLINVRNWVLANKLTLNPDKTHYVLFQRNKPLPPTLPDLRLGRALIKKEDSTKFLGVFLDFQLNWKPHIQYLQSKLSKQCGLIYQTKQVLTKKALLALYNSLIYPHLSYCQIVWGSACPTTLKPIVITQKRIIRTILGLRKYDHTNDGFLSLQLLKLNHVIVYCCCLFLFKCLHTPGNEMFSFRVNDRYNIRARNMLNVPFMKSQQSQSSILYHGPVLWNSLPERIRNCNSLHSFKRLLKQHLISEYTM